jgi:hypothetical protein
LEVASSGATLLSLLCNSANAREAAHNPLVPKVAKERTIIEPASP